MKRKISYILFAVLLIPVFFAALAFFNNVVIALQWDPSTHNKVYQGPIHRLDWSAVDFSTVTTFIPFYGLLMVAIGFLRAGKGKKPCSDYFPYTKNYNAITVNLGLIGTVWGLIMVGYYEPKSISMMDLIYCLRTALYSTLMALVWVFLLVIPIIRPLMQRWYGFVTGCRVGPSQSVKDIKAAVENLGALLNEFSAQVSSAFTNMKGLNEQLSTFSKAIEKDTKSADSFSTKMDALIAQMGVLTDKIKELLKLQLEQTNRINTLQLENRRLDDKLRITAVALADKNAALGRIREISNEDAIGAGNEEK